MRMKLDRDHAGGPDHRRKQRAGALRREQTGRVLDRDEVGLQRDQLERRAT